MNFLNNIPFISFLPHSHATRHRSGMTVTNMRLCSDGMDQNANEANDFFSNKGFIRTTVFVFVGNDLLKRKIAIISSFLDIELPKKHSLP